MDPLVAFRDGGRDAISIAELTLEVPLVRAVQARLAFHGVLEGVADGVLGTIGQWALDAFCHAVGIPAAGRFGPGAAAALLRERPALPLHPGGDLAGRVATAMLERGHFVARHPDCLTIAYVEGLRPDGTASARRIDAFDDARLLLRVGADGRPVLAGAWDATAAPGRPAVEGAPEGGAPRLMPGQHRGWVLGRTGIGTPIEQDALVQAVPLPVTRDSNRDFRRRGDAVREGFWILDQHGGLDAPEDRVGEIGAGCLIGREQAGHEAFLRLLRGDARWRANSGYLFQTALLDAADLSG